MNLTMRNFGVLGIASIAFTAEVARLGLIQWIIPVTQPTVDHHPFAEQRLLDRLADTDDRPHGISSLNAWKRNGSAAPGSVFSLSAGECIPGGGITVALGIPGTARIDVGVIEAACCNPDQHFVRLRHRNRPVAVKFQFVQTAMTRQNHGVHRLRDIFCHGTRSSKP